MAVFNSLLFLSVIFTTYLTSDALRGESIISNNLASEGQFRYQAAFMGKKNNSHKWDLKGSGVVITPKHILGAAQTFIDEHGNHRELTFSVVVDELDLNSDSLIYRDVLKFFLPGAGGYQNNDISVTELNDELDNPNIDVVQLPRSILLDLPRDGTVSGYGFNWVKTKYDVDEYGYRLKSEIEAGDTDKQLRFEDVQRVSYKHCKPDRSYNSRNYFCGEMSSSAFNNTDSDNSDSDYIPDGIRKTRGLCVLDNGNPLVVQFMNRDYVIGIASTHNSDCNDEALGGLYTNVEVNFQFIEGAANNQPLSLTLVYMNRHHEMNNELPGTSSIL